MDVTAYMKAWDIHSLPRIPDRVPIFFRIAPGFHRSAPCFSIAAGI